MRLCGQFSVRRERDFGGVGGVRGERFYRDDDRAGQVSADSVGVSADGADFDGPGRAGERRRLDFRGVGAQAGEQRARTVLLVDEDLAAGDRAFRQPDELSRYKW